MIEEVALQKPGRVIFMRYEFINSRHVQKFIHCAKTRTFEKRWKASRAFPPPYFDYYKSRGKAAYRVVLG